jgi:pyridoxal phosphate enzyme (YggS family)
VTTAGAAGRAAELADRLAQVRARIAVACAAAGRQPGEITLIAVTKTFPASDVGLLAGLGVTDIGENRDQEARAKAAECAALGWPVRWHFVGQLQVNKCASVARYADVVHSVDRPRLVTALGARARAAGRQITCLVQVSLEDAPASEPVPGTPADVHRGGTAPADVPALARMIADEGGLLLGGVMAVAPLGEPPAPAFRRLRQVADQVRSEYPDAKVISAGMSADLDAAIAEGATHVRVGTALLGGRRAFVR